LSLLTIRRSPSDCPYRRPRDDVCDGLYDRVSLRGGLGHHPRFAAFGGSVTRAAPPVNRRQRRGFKVRNITDIKLLANFETETTLESKNCSCPSIPRNSLAVYTGIARISESGHEGAT
jgi:hypothetical protein